MTIIKKFRNMKVYGQSGYRYRITPAIMMKGQWLKECGFDIGEPIVIKCEAGKLTITKVEVDQEAKPLMVAESEISYGRKRA